MPIQEQNIVFVESQVMDDVPEGGGAATGRVIVDGQMNNVFDDINDLDRVTGRFKMRKISVAVRTLSTDKFGGAKTLLTGLPLDPAVNYTIFTNNDPFDTRAQAADRVASYLFASSEWAGFLLENHIVGQRSIQIFQRVGTSPPTIGRTLVLVFDEGLAGERRQYVRVTRVETQNRTFTYNVDQDYEAQVVTCDLSDALRFDFPGSPPNRNFTRATGKTLLRDTRVTDAAQYYGAHRLQTAAVVGDVAVKVPSAYAQLVPSAQTENPVVDRRHSADFLLRLATTPRVVDVAGSPLSQRFKIGQENRGFNYTTILKPLPAPGSVRIVYRALGNTYKLADDGAGNLTGDGSGTVNYLTGSVLVTLAALPDDRSAVVLYWGPNQSYTNRAGQALFVPPQVSFELDYGPVVRGSVVVTWTAGGVLRTATDNGKGELTGDATGAIDYHGRKVFMAPGLLADAGGQYSVAYEWASDVEEVISGVTVDGSGFASFTLAQQPTAGTLELEWIVNQAITKSSGGNKVATTSVKQEVATAVTGSRAVATVPATVGTIPNPRGYTYTIPPRFFAD